MVESVGRIVEALRHQPILLAILLMNALFVTVFFWVFQANSVRQQREFELMLERCLPPPAVGKGGYTPP